MITQETLQSFLLQRENIIAICAEKGFTNLSVTIPELPDEKDVLQLFAKVQNHQTDMFDKFRLGNQLTQLLGYKISLYTLDQIPSFLKEEALSKAALINDINAIAKLFSEAIEANESNINIQAIMI